MCDQGNAHGPHPSVPPPFMVQTLVPQQAEQTRLVWCRWAGHNNKKAENPKLWGREQTYLGENSFSSRYFHSLWPLLLSHMQVESNVFVVETGQQEWGELSALPAVWGMRPILKGPPPPPPRKGPGGHRPKPPGVSPFLPPWPPQPHTELSCNSHMGIGGEMLRFLLRAAEPKFAQESKCTIYYNPSILGYYIILEHLIHFVHVM